MHSHHLNDNKIASSVKKLHHVHLTPKKIGEIQRFKLIAFPQQPFEQFERKVPFSKEFF